MADNCEESAGNGQNVSFTGNSVSSLLMSGNSTVLSYESRGVSSKCRTTAFCFSCSVLSVRSFHIRYLANENVASTTSSTTSQPLMSLIALETVFQIPVTSKPESSFGNSVSCTPSSSSKSWRSISRSVGLKRGSSSCNLRLKPERALRRSSETGTRMSGARYFLSSFSSRVHDKNPSAR